MHTQREREREGLGEGDLTRLFRFLPKGFPCNKLPREIFQTISRRKQTKPRFSMGALCGFSSLPNLSPSLRVTSLLKKPHPKSSQGISEVSLSPSVTVGIPPNPCRGHLGLHRFCSVPNPSWSSEPPKRPPAPPAFSWRHRGVEEPFSCSFSIQTGGFWHLFLASTPPLTLTLLSPAPQKPNFHPAKPMAKTAFSLFPPLQ